MHQKKKLMKRAAASAVALSTIASGLSLGVASATAAPTSRGATVEVRGLNFTTGGGAHGNQVMQMRDLRWSTYATYSEAYLADATRYRIPTSGSTSLVARLGSNGFPDKCLSHANSKVTWVNWASCAEGNSSQRWKRNSEGKLQADGTNNFLSRVQGGTWGLAAGTAYAPSVLDQSDYDTSGVFTNADLWKYTVDHNAGTVTFPKWYSLLWGIKIDGVPVTVRPEDGEVAAGFTVSGLKAGVNRITFEGSVFAGGDVFWSDYLEVSVNPTLSASVSGADVERGSAVLNGKSPAGTERIQLDWTTASGEDRTRYQTVTAANGDWSYTLADLPVGATKVHLSALKGAASTAQADVDVALDVAQLDASAEISPDRSENAVVSGTAQKSALVSVMHGDDVVGSTTASATDGSYAIEIPAPGMGGAYDLRVVQKIRNGTVEAGETGVTVGYGAAVTISDPQDGDEVAAGESAVLQGAGEEDAPLRVYERGNEGVVLGSGMVNGENGSFLLETVPLEAREYVLVVEQRGKGNNVTTAEVTVNEGQSSVVAPSASVEFSADVTDRAVVKGTGAAGAQITVKTTSGTLGTTTVSGTTGVGTWELPIDAIGAGRHELTVEQVTAQGIRTVTTEIDYGSAVAVDTPAASTTAAVTLTGSGEDGAEVSFTDSSGTRRSGSVSDGRWSIEGFFADGSTPVEVSSRSKGALVTTASTTVVVDQEVVPVTVTTPSQDDVDNGRIRAGMVEFSGEATPFATITMDLWKDGRELFTTEADETGRWAGTGWVGESTYTPVIKQTVGGVTTESNWLTFSTVAYANLTEVRPTADDVVQPSNALFSGKGTPGATVSVWTGPKDSGWARQIASTTVNGDRTFSVRGPLTANTKYTVYTYQELGAKSDQVMNQIDTGAEIKDLADVAASNVGTTTTLTGKAQPGATVEFWTGPKDSGWAVKRFTTTADAYGHFTVSAYLSTGNSYVLSGYQSWAGGYFGASTTLEYTPTN